MPLVTAWLKPPRGTKGQDHLATIATCEALYQQLLPGITNVTNRARCYSFYPWLIKTLDQKGLPRDPKSLINLVRRAECVWCLIGINHEDGGESWAHGGGLAGRDKLVPAWQEISKGGSLDLDDYATLDEEPMRYFKNRLGGLGQYYLGVFKDLEILSGDTRQGLRYFRPRGDLLADVFAGTVDGDRFFRALRDGRITRQLLDRLADFCPCQLAGNPRERGALLDLFLNRKGTFFEESEMARRHTLVLILDLAQRLRLSPSAHAP